MTVNVFLPHPDVKTLRAHRWICRNLTDPRGRAIILNSIFWGGGGGMASSFCRGFRKYCLLVVET